MAPPLSSPSTTTLLGLSPSESHSGDPHCSLSLHHHQGLHDAEEDCHSTVDDGAEERQHHRVSCSSSSSSSSSNDDVDTITAPSSSPSTGEDRFLVLVGCRLCLTYFMVDRSSPECPRCGDARELVRFTG